MPKVKYGKLSTNNIPLYRHENQTILHLLKLGYDIQIIPKSNTLQEASHQSPNIILDLRRIKIDHNRCMLEAKRHFYSIKRLKRLKIITKSGKTLDIEK